jgi:hypothetical protein
MDTSESSKIDDIPRVEVEAGTVSTTPVTFPTTESNSEVIVHYREYSDLNVSSKSRNHRRRC